MAAERFHEHHLRVAEIMFRKPRFAVAEIILPHADEGLRIPQLTHGLDIGEKVFPPEAQRGGIVRRDVFQMTKAHVGHAGD